MLLVIRANERNRKLPSIGIKLGHKGQLDHKARRVSWDRKDPKDLLDRKDQSDR